MISLASHLRSFIPLTDEDERLLKNVTCPSRQLARRYLLLRAGDVARTVFVLESGWAASFIMNANGGRCITAVLLPGDLVASSALSTGIATESVKALTPITVLPVPAAALRAVMSENVKLHQAYLASVDRERAALARRLFMVSRSGAIATVAHLFLDLALRCGSPSQDGKVKFCLHMTQEQIGDCIGLTPVHINRTMRELQRQEVFVREDGFMIVDLERLRTLAGDEAHLPGLPHWR